MPEAGKNTLMKVSKRQAGKYKKPGGQQDRQVFDLVDEVFLDESVTYGKTGKLYIILNTQLFEQAVAVSAGGFRAKTKLCRNNLVAFTRYDHQHHLHFTRGKLFGSRLVAIINK